MEFGEWQVSHTKMYDIIEKKLQMNEKTKKFTYLFIIQNEQGQIQPDKLEDEYINDIFQWEKTNNQDVQYESFGIVSKKKEDRLYVQTGTLTTKKKVMGKEKEKQYAAKRYIYNISNPNV